MGKIGVESCPKKDRSTLFRDDEHEIGHHDNV